MSQEAPPPPTEQPPGQEGPSEDPLAALQALLAETEAQVIATTTERDAALAAAAQSAEEHAAARAAADQVLSNLSQTLIATTRRALLAENQGHLVPELVSGDTPETLEASVTTARAAFDAIAETLRSEFARQAADRSSGTSLLRAVLVPAGASPISAPAIEDLSPFAKITRALGNGARG